MYCIVEMFNREKFNEWNMQKCDEQNFKSFK